MSIWNKTFLKFTLIEWVVAIVIMLSLARFIWAEELSGFEDSFFESISLGGGARFLITAPLAMWYLHWLFKREQAKALMKRRKVVRPQVLVVSIGLLVLAITLIVLSTTG